jgi:phosphate transport system substrate-binding protein
MIPLLTIIGKAYMKKNPKETIEVNQKSLGQPGGIAALNAGVIDIAMSAMPLNAEQSKLPFKPLEIAIVSGVVAVSKDVQVANISSQQLCDIYSGKIKSWKEVGGADAAILVLTKPESDSTKTIFRKSFACMEKLIEAPNTILLAKSQEMFVALQTKQNAIGIVDGIALNDSAGKFKSLKIDGNSIDSPKWPYFLRNHLVISKAPKEGVKKFMEFVKSPEGQALIKADKAKPVNFSL